MASVSKDNFNNNLRFSLKTSMGKYSFEENDRQSWATAQRKVIKYIMYLCQYSILDNIVYKN